MMLWGYGCASHPPVLAKEPRKGETDMGFSFSAENVIPVIWFRRGLNRSTDIGLGWRVERTNRILRIVSPKEI